MFGQSARTENEPVLTGRRAASAASSNLAVSATPAKKWRVSLESCGSEGMMLVPRIGPPGSPPFAPSPVEGDRTGASRSGEPNGQHATKSESVLCIVHEVSQPLAAIRTNAEVALRWLTRANPDLAEAREALEHVIGNSDRAANVVRSFRDLVRKTPRAAASVDVNRVIRNLLDLVSLDLKGHQIAVETDLAENLEPITGDRGQLEQVVANLIANAIEAMRDVHHRRRELRISTELDTNGEVLITVEDSGEGLDPALADRIFDSLFTTKPEGTGLGLWICRSIVETHGGRLWATPNIPYGTVFSVVIPAAPQTETRAAS